MQEKKYNDAKKEIRSVLLTYQSCITLEEFLKSYKNILGERLPSKYFGFHSDVQFLQSMPDVVNVRTDDYGKVLLTGIADETSQHIQELVSKQKKAHPKNSKSKNNFERQKRPNKLPVVQEQTFLPSVLRAEILQLMDMYHGVTFCTFAIAYYRKFKKYLPLHKGLDSLESMINLIPELEIKSINDEKVICFANSVYNKEPQTSATMKNIPPLAQTKDKGGKKVLTNCISPSIHKSGIPEDVLQNLKLVLEKCPEGIKDIYLPSLYEHLTHKSFNLHELGYFSILDLVDALPHIFKRVLDPEGGKNWIILPAATKTKHFPNGICSKSPVGGIPADAASPSLQFIKAAIPQNVNLNQHIPVFVFAINSPDLFWFQLQNDDTAKELEAFETDIGNFYDYHAGSKYVMHDSDIAIGSTCVVRHPKDKKWYRAIIKGIPNIKSVNVSFVDYGSRENVPRSNVYYVRSKYHDYPAQAFKAQLACLQPAKSAKTWDARAVQRFIQLCECPFLMAHINPIDEDTFSVDLCNVSGELDVHISDTLIKEGFAEICLENFDKSYCESDCKESVSDWISSDRESYFASGSNEHTQNETHEITSESDAEMFNFKGKLVVSPQKQLDSFKANTLHSEQIQESKRFVKQVELCEAHRIHIIKLEDKLYMTCGEISKLVWKDRDSSFLIERLKYKDVNIPFIKISKESNVTLFKQCICYKIPEYETLKPSNSSLILCPLESALEVLNVFGYPFSAARLTIENEISRYDPSDPLWNEFSYEEFTYFSEAEKYIEEELNRLCLYDLKAKNEALQIQKLKLLRMKNDSTSEEIKKIDCMQKFIERRMKKIENVISQYPSLL